MQKCALCNREKEKDAEGWLDAAGGEVVCPVCQEIPALDEYRRLSRQCPREIGEGCTVVRRGRIVAVESMLMLQSVLARAEVESRSVKGRSPERARLQAEKCELRVAVRRLREWLFMSFGASSDKTPAKEEPSS